MDTTAAPLEVLSMLGIWQPNLRTVRELTHVTQAIQLASKAIQYRGAIIPVVLGN